eukprot:COSAG04_NODE_14670_length_559_cov_6.600304_1_plen_90_part_00
MRRGWEGVALTAALLDEDVLDVGVRRLAQVVDQAAQRLGLAPLALAVLLGLGGEELGLVSVQLERDGRLARCGVREGRGSEAVRRWRMG